MRLRWLLIVFGLSVWLSPLRAQSSVLSVGVRGGGQLWLPVSTDGATEVKCGAGGNAVLDLRYSFYGCMANDLVGLGFTLGAGVGYGGTKINGKQDRTFTNTDYLDNQLDYTTSASFCRADKFATGEVSLMAALAIGGFTFNIGPRLMLPFRMTTTQAVTDATIDAYIRRLDVTVTNEAVTGKLNTPYAVDAEASSLAPYYVLLGMEAGWEFMLSRDAKGWLGLQLYANVGLWSNETSGNQTPSTLISVSPITGPDKDATVIVGNPDGLIGNKRYLDCGLRIYYALPVGSQRHARRINTRDTRYHRNRYRYY